MSHQVPALEECLSDSGPVARPGLHLRPFAPADVGLLMQWLPDRAAVAQWSPDNSFPFERERFIREAKLFVLYSWLLVDAHDVAVAFGQFSERFGCCHLSRLVVAPAERRKGHGRLLVTRLAARGLAMLQLERCSLFVANANTTAQALYRSLGFAETPFHDPLALQQAQCLFLTRPQVLST